MTSFVAREQPIGVFVSSRISPALEWARREARDEILRHGVFEAWLFEDAPPSTEAVDAGYLRRVRESDLVVWLVSSDTTAPVLREIRTALGAKRPILVFRVDEGSPSDEVERLIELTGGRWGTATTPEQLHAKLGAALRDEVVRRFRSGAANITSYFAVQHGASIARCLDRWLALGVPEALARSMSTDHAVGRLVDIPNGVTVVVGPLGSGKSLAAERFHQSGISAAMNDPAKPFPLFIEARELHEGLRSYVFRELQSLGIEVAGIQLVVDGLDEAPERQATLLTDARRLALEDPRHTVLIASRTVPDQSDLYRIAEAPPLSESDSLQLMSLVAGREIERHELWRLSIEVREAIQRPLFAVLVALGAKDHYVSGRSVGGLLQTLVERSLGPSEARRHSSEPRLRKLARICLQQGVAYVPPSALGAYHELEPLFRSRLVVERNTRLGFPLAIFVQWFAAQALSAGEVDLDLLLRDVTLTERWRPAIELQLTLEPDRDDITEALALRRPGLASQIIQERDEPRHEVPAPPWNEAGAALRRSVHIWSTGVGGAVQLTGCMKGEEPRTLGIRTAGEWVETAWLADATSEPVIQLVDPLFADSRPKGPALLSARGTSWRSAWYRSLDEIRSAFGDLLKIRNVPVVDALLPEAAWFFARKLTGTRGWREKEISLDRIRPISSVLSKDGQLLLEGRRLHSTDIHHKILPYIEQVSGGVARAPWPPPDRFASYIFECFDITTTVERTRLVYEAALIGYVQIVREWFSGLWPDLELAQNLPGEFQGIVTVEDGPHGRFPALTYAWVASTSDDFVSVNVSHGTKQDVADFVASRIQAGDGYGQTVLSDVFRDDPATDLAYGWLVKDLQRIAWLR